MKYSVTVRRSYTVDVDVEANSPEEAADKVNTVSFPLPDLSEWSGVKDWIYTVRDENGDEVYELAS